MGKATIKIPLVTWREGRPRFFPGPKTRKLGFAGEDLRHPDGAWYTLEECLAWSKAMEQRIADAKKGNTRRPRKNQGAYTIGELFEDWLKTPRMNGHWEIDGKKKRRPLAATTVAGYRKSSHIVRDFDNGYYWVLPAAALSHKAAAVMIDRIERGHGLAQARAIRAAVSAAFTWGAAKGLPHPFKGSDFRLPTLEPRVRYGEVREIETLIAAADAIGLPEIGDAIMLGVWTGQRQNDRLALEDGQDTGQAILFRQSKKSGQPLLIPKSPQLVARLAAARQRRAHWRINYPHVVLDEKLGRPFSADRYRKLFRKVREAAIAGVPPVKPCPSLQGFRDQDLRDTAVTWLALSENSLPFICSITGHSLEGASRILKHYLGLHPEMARTAIGRLVAWYETQSGEAQ